MRLSKGVRFLIFLLALAALLAIPGQAPAQTSHAARAAWGFDRSDLAPHPGVRFGVLANGMRYALMRSAAPAGSLSVRLHVAVGANSESDRERGFAHLIEHLIFHGTPNFPEGSLPVTLPLRGLRSPTDFSAFTSYDETVYSLDLARSDAPARGTALMLMREIAGNLAFGRGAVEGAKRKVREEIGGRDSAADAVMTARNAFFLPGAPIARGPVAGTTDEVARATGEALRRLYERHYVPQRSTLVLVGDFDPDAAETEIAARFGDWQARGAPLPDLSPPTLPSRGAQARLFVHADAPTTITIATVEPLGAADASSPRDTRFLQHLASEMLNRRFAALAAQPNAPFASATVAIYDHFSTARIAEIELKARDRDWRGAVQAGQRELRRAISQGFSQSELNEQLAASRAALTRSAGVRTASALADAIVDSVGRRIVFTAPADPSASAAYLARVRLAEVNAAFRSAWSSSSRLVFVTHNRRIPDAEAEILGGDRQFR